ncbi:CRISPR-associated endonuclease Cas2 [Candidatus Uhrbacteria bacterium]|nr:CRISPR-associated endonuclease Cas2 [Candidatus Uhrbacteria bacterium]
MPRKKKNPSSKLRERLTEARCCLQELAGMLHWACSAKNYIPYGLYQETKREQLHKEQREQLQYLKRRKLIEIAKIGKRLNVRLTDKGWTAALRDKIKTTKTRCKSGRCFLLFDIPEKERAVRNVLRQFLKECGFIHLQHSVWMTDRDVIEPLRTLLQRRKLERWIRIIVGDIVAASPLDRLVIRQNYRR